MALSTSVSRAALLSFLVILTISSICLEANDFKLKKRKMAFYVHYWKTPTKKENITNIPDAVAGNRVSKWNILAFGTVFVFDDVMTVGIERNSTEIGRTHGTYLNSALDGSDLHVLASFIFTSKKYNGSTIEIQGADRFYFKTRDLSVVGGTDYFSMVRGTVTLETIFLDSMKSNAVVKFNLTVYHY